MATLFGFLDTNWANNKNTCHSTFGFCFLLANVVISWANHKQTLVVILNTKSKYMALSKVTIKAIWLKNYYLN